jgi:folate-binding protein YgfZ
MPSSDPRTVTEPDLCWADLGRHEQVLVSGADAVSFIENFTTAKVGDLQPGAGREGFFCDARGWVIDLALIRRTADGLLLRVASGRAAPLLSHLDRYHIREELELADRSEGQSSLLVGGTAAVGWLAERFDQKLPVSRLAFTDGLLAAAADDEPLAVRLTLIDWYGEGEFLLETTAGPRLAAAFAAAGLPQLAAETVTARRLQQGWPLAEDIPEKTLPQELGLDDRAICFTKGCYLGQETVARLDALGHVNRRLTLLAVTGAGPGSRGMAVVSGDTQVATVTSAAPAMAGDGWLALAIVPLKAAAQELTIDGRVAILRPFFTQGEQDSA